MIKNLLTLTLIMSSTALVGCGSDEGNEAYGFVVPDEKPIEMDSPTKSVTINVDGLLGEELIKINLLDGMSIDGQALTEDTRDVYIRKIADKDFDVDTVPALGPNDDGKEVLFFDYELINEENATNAGSEEQLKKYLIQPVQVENNTLLVNRHLFRKAQKGLTQPQQDTVTPFDPTERISQVTYTISYEVDNGYPCISLESSYRLGQCTDLLMEQGNVDLCNSADDSVEACGEYIISNNVDYVFECDDVDNCTSAELDANYKTALTNAVISKIQDADGNLPNIRTLTLVVNNNVDSPDL
ncbi:hypothetical protein [Pseudocolwellia agarivorans]|uniref:hypothetical protein n=1 Tax=Pseudocolwellia agarivorans TaxID=1911682 RepID=UPI00098533E4|nr:hypothetical protein [Pseudocolwellia agarivorans]